MDDVNVAGQPGPWMSRSDGSLIKFEVMERNRDGATLVRCTAKRGHIQARHTVTIFGWQKGLADAGAEAEAKARHKLAQLLEPNDQAAIDLLAKLGRGVLI